MSKIDNCILAKYLSGEASEEECLLVEHWMDESLSNKKEVENLREGLTFVSSFYVDGKLDSGKAWNRVYARIGKPRIILFYRKAYRVAAVALMLILGGFALYWFTHPSSEWIVVNSIIDKDIVYLPDSTEVILARNSSLRYDKAVYGCKYRAVQMNGKAFFRVRRDPAHPFTIVSNQTNVRVLGTAFQVETNMQESEVWVEYGKVAFSAKKSGNNVILTAGISAKYSSTDNKIVLQTKPDTNELSWVTGVLRFNETSLIQVVSTLEKHYHVLLKPVGNIDKQLTATFNNMLLPDVLKVINETLDVKLEIKQ